MDNAGITKIIAQLEEIRRRPLMWLGKIEVLAGEISATEPFLNGFNSACAGLGYNVSFDIREEVTKELGWNWSAQGPIPNMLKRGLSGTAIVDAMIDIEIEGWKRLLSEARN